MSGATLTQRPLPWFTDPSRKLGSADVRRPRESSDGGRLTLEQRLDGVWEGLRADGVAECPVCRAQMHAAAGGAAGRCGGCGSTLS